MINSSNSKVKIGGAALLICAAKVSHQRVVEDLSGSNLCTHLIQALVAMLNFSGNLGSDEKDSISVYMHMKEELKEDGSSLSTGVIDGVNLAVWLLSVLASHDDKCKIVIMEAGAVEVLTDRISYCFSNYSQVINYLFRFYVFTR